MNLPEFFGLDIGNHTIKVCLVKWNGKIPVIETLGSAKTNKGVIGSENPDDQKQLAQNIKDAVKDAGIKTKNVVVGLPESNIFTQLVTIPKVEDAKIDEVVHWEAKKYIPIPIDEVTADWIYLGERTINNVLSIDLFLIAAPNTLIQRYKTILNFAELEPIGIETESIATARAIWWKQQNGIEPNDGIPVLVVDMGSKSTDLSVVIGGTLLFSKSLVTGSDALTEAISTTFGLEWQQAEEYKKSYGIDESQLEGKIANSIKPVVNVIISEVNKVLDFFKSRFPKSTPKKILLVGDGSRLPAILTYFASETGLEVSVADPFFGMKVSKRSQSKLVEISSAGYSVALGLALKNN